MLKLQSIVKNKELLKEIENLENEKLEQVKRIKKIKDEKETFEKKRIQKAENLVKKTRIRTIVKRFKKISTKFRNSG